MDIHILEQSDDQKTILAIFHIAVPAVNNDAGISYQTALMAHLGGAAAITSRRPKGYRCLGNKDRSRLKTYAKL